MFQERVLFKCTEFRSKKSKFRISAHQLHIETGRYERKKNQAGKISILEREERVCLYCNLSKVEDESHFLLECPLYNHERSFFFNEIGSICEFFLSLNNHDKFYWILNNEDYKILSIFSTFLKTCFSLRKQYGVQQITNIKSIVQSQCKPNLN